MKSAQPGRLEAAAAARLLTEADRAGLAVVEIVRIEGDHAGRRLLLFADGTSRGSLGDASLDAAASAVARNMLEGDPATTTAVEMVAGERLFLRVQRPAERLVIVGAGHIAVPLAELGVRLGFAVTVLDDREEFATPDRFPGDADVRPVDFTTDPFAGTSLDARTSIALVTRGHRWDFDCLRRLLEMPVRPRYIGMIGSRRRVRAAFTALLAAGVARERLAGIHAPIGIEIGAETPEEIAVSIAAELIAMRRGHTIEAMTSRERVLERLLPERVETDG
jgi:xanthine dehydrogenase accessory factor